MIKLTPSEQVQRSRLKKDMLIKDSSWSKAQIKIYLAEIPELWVTKGGKTDTEFEKRLQDIKEGWCPSEIVYWNKRIKRDQLKKKSS